MSKPPRPFGDGGVFSEEGFPKEKTCIIIG